MAYAERYAASGINATAARPAAVSQYANSSPTAETLNTKHTYTAGSHTPLLMPKMKIGKANIIRYGPSRRTVQSINISTAATPNSAICSPILSEYGIAAEQITAITAIMGAVILLSGIFTPRYIFDSSFACFSRSISISFLFIWVSLRFFGDRFRSCRSRLKYHSTTFGIITVYHKFPRM